MKRVFTTIIIIFMLSAAAFAATVTVNKVEDTFDWVCDADCSLRDALINAGVDGTVLFATPLFSTPQTINVNGEITLYGIYTIVGPGTNLLTIRNVAAPGYTSRVFVIPEDGAITMTGFKISGGRTLLSEPGGAIINRGILTLDGMILTDNASSDRGGAVCNTNTGTLTVQNSTFSGNSGSSGGALVNFGNATVSNAQFTSNTASSGGAINNLSNLTMTGSTISGSTVTASGGGIANQGTLTITNSSISGNSANNASNPTRQGGGIYNTGSLSLAGSTIANNLSRYGGGINNEPGGSIQITNSTISGNNGDGGGGIQNLGSVTVNGSTFSGNYATDGGAIGNFSQLDIRNSTLSGNSANGNRGGAIYNQSSISLIGVTIAANTALNGGGVFNNGGTITSKSTIVSGNSANAQCPEYRGPMVSEGFNLVNDPTACVQIYGGPSDIVGVDARLAPLGNYGGPTQTQALCTAVGVPHSSCVGPSPALDKGSNTIPLSSADQRGTSARTINNPTIPNATSGDGTDIGAYESHLYLYVTKTVDTNDGSCDNDCSLREAIAIADAGDTIQFPPANSDMPLTFSVNGQLVINKNLTIIGNGANQTILRSIATPGPTSRVLSVVGGTVRISGVTVSGGRLNGLSSGDCNGNKVCGAGIYNTATLTVTDSAISDNTTDGSSTSLGGGVFNSGTISIINSTLESNFVNGSDSKAGGGLYNGLTATLANVTISGNGANSSSQANGGGIANDGTANLNNVTVSNNSATAPGSTGGGIRNALSMNSRNTLVSGNSASTSPNATGNIVGSGQNNIVDGESLVKLAPLGYYGGTTLSQPVLSGSTAINAGTNCVTSLTCGSFNPPIALTADQRGASRVGTVDIGAFEVNSTATGGTFRGDVIGGRLSSPYSMTLVPNTGAMTYSITAGALPPGVNLSTALAPQASLVIAGTPTVGGVYNFTVTGTSAAGSIASDYRLNVLVPTAAGVTVSGRVITASGAGLTNAIVTLTDSAGVTRSAKTSTFGNFRFGDVAAGQTYVVQVVSKRYVFAPQVVYVGDELTGLEFVGEQ